MALAEFPPGRELPVHDARARLLDLHFEVRDAIAEVIEAPTTARQVALQRAVFAFIAAARLVADEPPAPVQQLGDALSALDRAGTTDDVQRAVDGIRRAFFDLSTPLLG
jgi:hypothetical protein